MKAFINGAFVVLNAALLSACCPNGCFVVTGKAFEELAYPTPHLVKWEKSGATPEVRLRASQECGGGNTNNPGFSADTVAQARKPGESRYDAYSRLFRDYQRCLIAKGYKYVGECPDNEVARISPACGAP